MIQIKDGVIDRIEKMLTRTCDVLKLSTSHPLSDHFGIGRVVATEIRKEAADLLIELINARRGYPGA